MVTVGALFGAYQIAVRKREEARDEGDYKKLNNYGTAFAACIALEEILKTCRVEIELPPQALTVIVPLLATLPR
ncbi:MAG: hypothetical protein A2174_02530 [Candidatus Portnoybacteria bacterium RBG_13_41_18]|uniref:Uncharacterized protein n=1 Tax=Candidatus Portnoybacteria bacterium RBG_13_41_18 TaxID=1801991 RepID=A0A1G2FA70_9BACT|nr:MAG: hypothetical protein A2174_02530 [Candidatus Portnoybacteria bacterium RBG_13_41_18]